MAVCQSSIYVSAILSNEIPGKDKILTQIPSHWLSALSIKISKFRRHLLALTPLPLSWRPPRAHSSTADVCSPKPPGMLPIELLIMEYTTANPCREFVENGTAHAISQPAGL